MSKAPPLAGVIGWPIAHSLSPLIHRTWAEREQTAAYYIPIGVKPAPGALAEAVKSARGLGFRGLNVTLPFKEEALAAADHVSLAAREIGAANMLTFNEDGITADNSDAMGFADALRCELRPGETPASALVLGAGGAARAVVHALKTLIGVRSIVVANRSRDRAEEIASRFGVATVDWLTRDYNLDTYDLVVNATSLGMDGQRPLALASEWRRDAIVADIVYSPLKTGLLASALKSGARTVDGLAMLMAQAVPGYLAWLGKAAVVDDDLRDRLEGALASRGKE